MVDPASPLDAPGSAEAQARSPGHGSAWLTAILDSSQDAIMAWTLTWQLSGWNIGAERLLGYSPDEALQMSVKALWKPELMSTLEYLVADLCRDAEVSRFDTVYVRRDGSLVDVAVTMTAIRDAAGRVTGITSIVHDITEHRRSERQLAEERTRWVAAFHGAPTGMALVDLEGRWLDVNEALCRTLQRDRETLLATDLRSLSDLEALRGDAGDWARVMSGEAERYQAEVRCRVPEGEPIWVQINVSLVRGLLDEPLYFVVQVQDVTAAREAMSELEQYAAHLSELARYDPVTGLPNAREFDALIEHELQRSRRYGRPWSVAQFAIDGFARLSEADRLRADHAVTLTARALGAASRGSDRACRVGPDRFALILPETDRGQAAIAARRVVDEVARTGIASLSHSVASWPQDGESVETLLGRAADELRQAQAHGAPPAEPVDVVPLPGCETGAIHDIVSVARKFLEMDVAYLAVIEDGTQTFQTMSGDPRAFGFTEGESMALSDTYCQRMLERLIPHVVPVVADQPELARLPVTARAGIGAYVGVPVNLANGHLYGTLCAISQRPVPELADTDLGVMRSFASLIASHIEHDVIGASVRRQTAESTGINALLSALSARDHYTGEHSEEVVRLAGAVAVHLGLSAEEVREVEQVALLHDIGKVGIPDAILQKRGPLSEQEWEVMRQHPTIGARVLAGVPMFAHLADAVSAEHERFDGSGYPDGRRGDEIPLASRITLACDAYQAMTSTRPYRQALGHDVARRELQEGAGTQFDPEVVAALLTILDADGGGGRVDAPAAEPRAVTR
jgi:PAS domain S-box-containing protein/diguanylate cyclase (GGDEF)-like protein